MSKEVDILVLIGSASYLSSQPPSYLHEIIEQMPPSEAMTPETRDKFYATKLFLELGKLAASMFFDGTMHPAQPESIHRENVQKILEEIFVSSDEDIPKDTLENTEPITSTSQLKHLPRLLDSSYKLNANHQKEFEEKWALAQEIFAKRGMVTVATYGREALLGQLESVDIDASVPSLTECDEDGNIVRDVYSVADLLDKPEAPLQPDHENIPYYQTFGTDGNETQMLEHALEDLVSIRNAIQN